MKARSVYYILVLLLASALLIHGTPGLRRWIIFSLIIATLKSLLILYHYMDLKRMSHSMRWIALGSVFWLLILFALTAADYYSRAYFFL